MIRDDFAYQLYLSGLETDDRIIIDGKLHRFHVIGDRRGTKNGWYIVFTDFPVVAVFGCWKRHIKHTWLPHRHGNLTVADQRRAQERALSIESRIRQTFATELASQAQAAEIWRAATPASDRHRYLVNKQVRSHGLRYHQGALLIPVMDAEGRFHGLQRIWPNGSKRFFHGTTVTGNFYMLSEIMETGMLLIAEGYATSATLFEVTGHSVAMCFSSENMLSAAQVIRNSWPSYRIIICADDDHAVPDNPGLTAARAAAEAIGAELIRPLFTAERAPGDSDFNDFVRLYGKEALRSFFDERGNFHV